MARRGVGDDPHAQRPALLLHHQTHRPPDAGPAARLGRRLRESDRGLHSRESGGGRPPASAVAGSAPAPQADRLRTAARTARHRAIPHLRDRGGLRGRRIGQRCPSVRLRLGAFDPPAVSRCGHSLLLPPDGRTARQRRPAVPHPPPVPARAGPQGGNRLHGKTKAAPVSRSGLLNTTACDAVRRCSRPAAKPAGIRARPAPCRAYKARTCCLRRPRMR